MTPDYIVDALQKQIKELKQLYCRLMEKGREHEAEEVFQEAVKLSKNMTSEWR